MDDQKIKQKTVQSTIYIKQESAMMICNSKTITNREV